VCGFKQIEWENGIESMKEIEWAKPSRAAGNDFVGKEGMMDLGRPEVDITITRFDDGFTNDEVSPLYNSIGFGIIWGNANMGSGIALHEFLECALDFTTIVSDNLGDNSIAANDFFPKECGKAFCM